MGADLDTLLTAEEAAARIRISTKTLRQLRRRGLIRYVAITARKICYRPEDCAAYIASKVRLDDPSPIPSPRPRGRTRPDKAGNVVSFTAQRQARRGLGAGR
jgi:hypothetical protein